MAEYTESRVWLPLKTTSYGWPLCYCHYEPMRALPGYKWDCKSSTVIRDYINAGLTAAIQRSFDKVVSG